MSRSCAIGRSCQHLLARTALDDDIARGRALRLCIGVVVVAGEKDTRAVAEVGAEQCRSNAEELLILVIPDLRDALDADCVHVLLLYWLLLRRLLRNDLGRPGAMAGLCEVPRSRRRSSTRCAAWLCSGCCAAVAPAGSAGALTTGGRQRGRTSSERESRRHQHRDRATDARRHLSPHGPTCHGAVA